jgi:hypothetical protein
MRDPPLCPEREFLRRAAAQAIETVYRLWTEHPAPHREPLLFPGLRILNQHAFKDALPWIVITLFENTRG